MSAISDQISGIGNPLIDVDLRNEQAKYISTLPTILSPAAQIDNPMETFVQSESPVRLSQSNASSTQNRVSDNRKYLEALPQRGNDADGQAAIQKLERIIKTKKSKPLWKKKSSTSMKPHRGEGVEQSGNVDEDSVSTTSVPDRFGEVKLAISSMPGVTFLASKARQGLSAAQDADDEDIDGDLETHPTAWGSLSSRLRGKRRSSMVPPGKEVCQMASPSAETRSINNLSQIFQGNLEQPTTERPKAVQASPDLAALKEEPPAQTAPQSVPSEPKLIRPKAERPRLMIQSPTEHGEESMMVQSPENITPAPNLLTSYRGEGVVQHLEKDVLGGEASSANRSPELNNEECGTGAMQYPLNVSRPSLLDDAMSCSLQSPSSGASGDDTDTEASSDFNDADQQIVSSLNLQHGNEMSKQEKRRLLRSLRRERRKQSRNGDRESTSETKRLHHRTASLGDKVASGLNYASSQSRNRRAMEKYSPHPSRPSSAKPQSLSAAAQIAAAASSTSPPLQGTRSPSIEPSPSSTPALGPPASIKSSRPSSIEEGNHGPYDVPGTHPQSIDDTEDDQSLQGDISKNFLRRWGTNVSLTSSAASMLGKPSFRKRFLSLRRNRQGPSDVAEEDQDNAAVAQEEADKALDRALQKLAVEADPQELKEKYEYDVLYENQRGILFFGIPKFSAKTLFQWDPAPWTDALNGDSVYNIANAQLPNPSWEWVHPEWMIDMSGDVDESGWQYSFNFGRLPLPLMVRPQQIIPRANSTGNEITNERFAKVLGSQNGRQSKEKSREDDGVEALKRSAITRQPKWSSIPTQNTYVRRRRWIRLRKRKATHTPMDTPMTGTPLGLSKASVDWAHVFKGSNAAGGPSRKVSIRSSSEANDDLSMSDYEMGSSSSSDEDVGRYESSFFPRRTQGYLKSGRDPLESRQTKAAQRRRRHAREFTGTIRELKSLLPAILDRRHGRGHRNKGATDRKKALWLLEIDARNPFLNWAFIKRRLEEDDLAFASTSLRARERRHAQRIKEKGEGEVNCNVVSECDQAGKTASESFELTKDALVEINFRRVVRVLRACKVDRQKLDLWRIWLGVDALGPQIEPSRYDDLINLGLAANSAGATSSLIRSKEELAHLLKVRWRQAYIAADPLDVWDVVERRLDRILMTFEYQDGRASFLRLLLTAHASSHAMHRYRPAQAKIGNEEVRDMPSSLLPSLPDASSFGETSVAGDEWRSARLPRLEFWSDLLNTARSLVDSHIQPTSPSRPASASPLPRSNSSVAQDDILSMSPPLRSRTPGSMTNYSFAMTPFSLTGNVGSISSNPHPRRLSSATNRPTTPRSGMMGRAIGLHNTVERPISTPPLTDGAERMNRFDLPPQSTQSEVDWKFLAEILQVPPDRQKEIFSASLITPSPVLRETNVEPVEGSDIVQTLTRAIDEDT